MKEAQEQECSLYADVLQNGSNFTWPQYAERNGLISSDAANLRWKRYARRNGYPITLKEVDELPNPPYPNFELRNVKKGKNGETINESWAKQPPDQPDFDVSGLEIESVTFNPYGRPWPKFVKPKNQLPALEELKALLSELSLSDFAKKDWTPIEKTGHIQVLSLGDVHIGMDSADNVFGHTWDKDKAIGRAASIGAYVDPSASKVVVIVGGDLNDGHDGKTTRKGHELPQNLNSKEQIRQSGAFCLSLLDSIAQATESEIEVVFIADSNHGGGVMDFAVGLMLQYCVPSRYSSQVTFHLQEKFIDVYKFGGTDFIVTHGYDEKHMPRGLPRFLSKDHITFFERVIEHYKLDNPIVWRYDQHQHHVIEYPKFKDVMTKAFASPSSWVSLNFAANDNGGFIAASLQEGRLSVESIDF